MNLALSLTVPAFSARPLTFRRMNTCRSASKQNTSTPLDSALARKPGRGCRLRAPGSPQFRSPSLSSHSQFAGSANTVPDPAPSTARSRLSTACPPHRWLALSAFREGSLISGRFFLTLFGITPIISTLSKKHPGYRGLYLQTPVRKRRGVEDSHSETRESATESLGRRGPGAPANPSVPPCLVLATRLPRRSLGEGGSLATSSHPRYPSLAAPLGAP